MDPLTRLQAFFRSLFQFDLADLDFGIYRLFHLKQTEIEAFITTQLPQQVDLVFADVLGRDAERARSEYQQRRTELLQALGGDALLPDGRIDKDMRETALRMPLTRALVEAYESAWAKNQGVQVSEGHKAEVFNHLVAFFSRYYDEGDFIPRRRYGARESYAVPYNGEEVFFHWANRDQHYVKTAERFQDYAFKDSDLTGQYRVRFTMAAASIARDNTKGNARYFFPRADLAVYDEATRQFTLPFEYRLPSPDEAERYERSAQDAILKAALPEILAAVTNENLRGLLDLPSHSGRAPQPGGFARAGGEGENAPTVLQRRLQHFCRRNTSDYFIHKNLGGFLQQELAFYIKEQVIHLMDLEADLEAKRRVVRTFRALAGQVIEFLVAVEDAQKTLFEKKKFVLETDHLIPVQHVPHDFRADILACEGQQAEWRAWYGIEANGNPPDLFNPTGEVNEAFLAAHPTLPLHTRHFDRAWVRRLLEALPFDDLDEATDGLLVHSENYQALNLLLARYREQVKCVYIDPPYNTGSDGFIYKDRYQHSSWLAMMEGRIGRCLELVSPNGTFLSSINDNEFSSLCFLMNNHVGIENYLGNLVWKGATDNNPTRIAVEHEYVMCYARSIDKLESHWSTSDNETKQLMLDTFERLSSEATSHSELRALFGEFVAEHRKRLGDLYRYRRVDQNGPYVARRNMENPGKPGYTYDVIHPRTGMPCAKPYWGWRFPESTMRTLLANDRIIFGDTEAKIPELKVYLRDVKFPLRSVFSLDARKGSNNLDRLFGSRDIFKNPKPVELLGHVLPFVALEGSTILDFFAGSGTTGHAVINLNREDGGRRSFILVEMGEYFDSVLLPRVAKVIYSPQWKEGRPTRAATPEEAERTPRLVKVLRLESYEDALHNLAAPATLARSAVREDAYRELAGEDAYRLRYWIELPLQEAATCLRALDLARPFDYKLETLSDDGPVDKAVDLVETFTYLYGLRVRRYESWQTSEVCYRVVKAADREGRQRILVLWRNLDDTDPAVERAFLEGQIAAMAAAGEVWDEILINGDSATPGVASLDPLFKQLLMAGEGA